MKWKHFQKSHKLSICGFTENITTVWERAHMGPVCASGAEDQQLEWQENYLASLWVSEVRWVEHYVLGFRAESLEAKDRCISPFARSVN